jgi:hypothetical protein
MSSWAKFKNYFFGVPLPKEDTPAPPPVVEVKKEEPVPVVKEEPKQLELKFDEVKHEATLTVTTSTVEVAPAVEAKPEKKKAPAKKRTPKKKSN